MDVWRLERVLEESEPAPIYVVSGEEAALADRAVELITARALKGIRSVEFALSRLEGKTATAEEIEMAARTASLFGGRRLVQLRDAQSMKPAEMEKLERYLKSPVSTTTLLLCFRGVGTDSRDPKHAKAAKAVKQVQKVVEKGGGLSVECPRPKPRDMASLAEQMLRTQGLRANRNAMLALVEAVGEDWGALEQAVTKLSLYLGGPGELTEEAVAEVVASTRTQSVFALTDAVGEGSPDRALRVLQGMLKDGEGALSILAQLAKHLRNLGLVLALQDRGEREGKIQEALGLHPFVVKKCLLQARRFSQASLARRILLLAEADRKLKSSPISDDLLMEKLVLELCQKK